MKNLSIFLSSLLLLSLISCSSEEEKEETERLCLKKTEKGYVPVVAPISQTTFQHLFTTGGWSLVKDMAVYADGSIMEKEPMVGGVGILYTFADGQNVQQLITVATPHYIPSLDEARYTYDEKDNTFAVFESSPLLNSWVQYTILSINEEEMRMTEPRSPYNDAEYVLEYYIFKHHSDDKVLEILHADGIEGY